MFYYYIFNIKDCRVVLKGFGWRKPPAKCRENWREEGRGLVVSEEKP
jgi:hypothetical protein